MILRAMKEWLLSPSLGSWGPGSMMGLFLTLRLSISAPQWRYSWLEYFCRPATELRREVSAESFLQYF